MKNFESWLTEIKENPWCRDPESNWGHADFQSAALPTELSRHTWRLNRF
jgi:hypothetical protein